jgi:hypothetical protein
MNNKLILRTTNGPWVTPISDINKGSVLTHVELDSNFIYLKGEVIYSATTSGGTINLHKINGDKISFSGGSEIDQNNKVDSINVNLNSPLDGVYTISQAVNNLPAFEVDEFTNLIVKSFKAPSRGGVREYVYGYWLLKPGKGKYGTGLLSTALTDADFENIGTEVVPITSTDPIEFNPDAIVYDISGFTGTSIEQAVNDSDDTYVIDNDDDVYFRLEIGDILYIYRWLGNQPITIGNGGSATVFDDYLEFSNEFSDEDIIFSGTYAQLNTIVENNELVVGRKYIMTDYKTVYTIIGSDSSDIASIHEVTGIQSGYSSFIKPIPNDILDDGDTVLVESLPVGYGGAINVGDTLSVIDWFSPQFVRLSPTPPIGSEIKITKQRYVNVPTDAIVNDGGGKPILKPFGVLNTEVHDDGDYGALLGVENPSPITEEIILTAIDTNQFSRDAESLSFVGDMLEYDFNDTELLDANGFVKSGVTRNGFILRRTNKVLDISIDKDWRVQRFRRYQMDSDNWLQYTFRGDNSALYETSGINYFTYSNGTITTNHRYVMREPSIKGMYIDFNQINSNPFLSGVTSAPSPTTDRLLTNTGSDILVDVDLPLSGLTEVKDLFIIPIENNEPTSDVERCNVERLNNSLFLNYSQSYGVSNLVNVDVRGEITNSSFMTGPKLRSSGGNIIKMTSLDYIEFTNNNITDTLNYECVNNFNNFTYAEINSFGEIRNLTLGTRTSDPQQSISYLSVNSGCNLFNSIIGGRRQDAVTLNDLQMSHCLLNLGLLAVSTFTGRMYLTDVSLPVGSFVSGVKMDLTTYTNQIPGKGAYGYIYNIPAISNDINVDNHNQNKDILHLDIDANNNISLITISNAQ